jgi:two-component system, LytTR family, response regulator
MKALIIDDERLARVELRRLLAAHPSIEIVDEAENGNDAVEKINRIKPSLIFLDIHMPGKNGFEVLNELVDTQPEVIFTTAFDSYALKAFEFSATDYLLKPIDPERLAAAIGKVQSPVQKPAEDSVQDDIDYDTIDEAEQKPKEANGTKVLGPEDQIFIKDGEKCYFIKLHQVRYFESMGNYVRLYFDNQKPMILRSLNAIEDKLDPSSFFRVNRKHIVNLKKVEQVEPYFSNGLLLKLEGGEKIEVSRRQAAKFKDLLSL